MQIRGYEYGADIPVPGGLARIATLVANARASARAEDRHVIFVDNGDVLQGSPLADFAAEDPDSHPLPALFRQMGYDAMGLGNHDFDYGLDLLAGLVPRMPCPVLCSNLCPVEPGGPTPFAASAVWTPDPEGTSGPRVGLLSVLPPQTVIWDAAHLDGRLFPVSADIAAGRTAADLRKTGCDLVLVLAHMGPGTQDHDTENAASAVLRAARPDAAVLGHAHLRFPGPAYDGIAGADMANGTLEGVPAVMPGLFGACLGQIDLDFTRGTDGTWRRVWHKVALRDATGSVAPDPLVLRVSAPLHRRTRDVMAEPVGTCAQDLHSHLSFCAPDTALALLAEAQAEHLRRSGLTDLPVLSAVSPARTGGRSGPGHFTDIPAGVVQRRHLVSLCPFDNALCALILSGAEVADWLERAAGVFHTLTPGLADQPLLDPQRPGYEFDVLHGLTYRIDLTRPARHDAMGRQVAETRRVHDIRLGRTALTPEMQVAVAVSGYRANDASATGLSRAPRLDLAPVSIRNLVAGRIASGRPVVPERVWSFSPVPDASAILRTAPAAARHVARLGDPAIEPAGIDEEGFLRLRIRL